MSSRSTQFANPGSMAIYEPIHHVGMWESTFNRENIPNTTVVCINAQVDAKLDNKSEYTSYDSVGPSGNNQETNKMSEKVQRRLAQNREAARKSRLRKKAYVQQLETYRLKLTQLEQELASVRQQGVYIGGALNTGHVGLSGPVNSAVTSFEMEYGHWIEEQQKHNCELRKVLQGHISDVELRILVDSVLSHYCDLFRMKADAAKADVFYVMSGIWRTSVERFFLWLGGFRPSELLNVLMPQLENLTDPQVVAVGNLRLSSQQAEEALSQGIDRLQQTLAQGISADFTDVGNHGIQMISVMEKLDALENFVNQADHLRQQTLQQMSRILTIRQAARGLLALGEYFHRLRALSSLWAARPREQPPAYNF
ncbi:transcription factor TGA3-like isoform X1 [Rhododendron vialii]|uniref:transcription factor TGA3-like isoform X1 n=1 Tax=Rhododendron vialii TaxID=182163 RepID=UPI00265F84AA|nr:transcription factor TGA3-like isoform X1 [Rhododendron vialii]XP_058224102.1 transcription factor TGA3-like isoform X1 [Rhododendron vialii]XP_058224103.1 transcription factor TGA3-like isoform X1 [Rhododendron vialii]XP_058224104.1 transcription factor TGA3-like isoform X1 [Rhododendron vialii]